MIKAIIWDVDGTMIDSRKAVLTALDMTLRELNADDKIELAHTMALRTTSEELMTRIGMSDPDAGVALWGVHLKELSHTSDFAPHVVEALQALKERGVKQGIVTSRTHGEVYNDVQLNKVLPYFCCVISKEDTVKHKPDAEPILLCCTRMGVLPEETLYIGDSPSDEEAAIAAKVGFVWASEEVCLKIIRGESIH